MRTIGVHRAAFVAACCGLAASASAQFDNSPWPSYRGTAAKRGSTTAPGPATTLAFSRTAFATCTPGGITIAANGDIYFKSFMTGAPSRVYRINPATGATLAMSPDFTGAGGNYAGVAVGTNAVYTCNYNGVGNTSVLKLDKSTLAVIAEWTNPAFQGLRGTPLIGSVENMNGRINIYVCDRNANMIHCLDSGNGAIQWSYPTLYAALFDQGGPMWVTGDGKQALAHFGNGNFGPGAAIKDNGDGTFTTLWQLGGPGNFNWIGSGALSPDGTRIYVTTFHDPIPPDPNFTDSMWAVSVADGSVIWHGGLPDGNHFGRPAVIANRVYAGNGGGAVYCYNDNGATGSIAWIYTNADPTEFTSISAVQTPAGDRFVYAIQQGDMINDGRLVVLKDLGATYQEVLDTTINGTMKWSLFSSSSGSIAADGSLWIGSGRVDDTTPGDLYKFGVGGGCYPDCNGDHALNVNDFVCFQGAFAGGNMALADCDHNSALNVNDFVCFQSAFAAGCSAP